MGDEDTTYKTNTDKQLYLSQYAGEEDGKDTSDKTDTDKTK